RGLPVREAILQEVEKRARPVMMPALTAIFGLVPVALSTRSGAQTARPLAIVVVGGMLTTLFLTRYLMPVLYPVLPGSKAGDALTHSGLTPHPFASPFALSRRWIRRASSANIRAVERENITMPFMASSGPSKRQRADITISP